MVHSQNFGVFIVATHRAFIHWDTSTYCCPSYTVSTIRKRTCFSATCLTAIKSLVALSAMYSKQASTTSACNSFWKSVTFVVHLSLALRGAVPLWFASVSMSNELLTTKEALFALGHVRQVVRTIAFIRAKVCLICSVLCNIELFTTLFAGFYCPSVDSVFASFWPSHTSIITGIKWNVKRGVNA
jgi:hypothetical protein